MTEDKDRQVSAPSSRHPHALDVLTEDEGSNSEVLLRCTKCVFMTEDLGVFTTHWDTWHARPLSRNARAKTVMRVIYEERDVSIVGYPQRTAERLNALGVPREQGGAWDVDGVCKYFTHWRDTITRPRRKVTPVAVQPTASRSDESNHWETLYDTVLALRDVADRLEKVGLAVVETNVENTEAREKARKWDELQALMGRRS